MKPQAELGLEIKLFGPLEARVCGKSLPGLQAREGERLLALLTLNHGVIVPSTTIASLLWPETGSLDSLRASVMNLRLALGTESARLKTPKGGIILDLSNADVDVITFDASAATGDSQALKQAVNLYRGHLLPTWEDRWAAAAREKRKERYREALKTLARYNVETRDYEAAAGYLKRYVEMCPAEEWAWCEWMATLVAGGERVVAMNVYQRCRETFQKFKLDPPADMTRLLNQIRQPAQQILSQSLSNQSFSQPVRQSSDFPTERPPTDHVFLEPVGGAVPLDSVYYIDRPADAVFQSALTRQDSIVLVKGPRQTGKTSLLARGMQQARQGGAAIVLTDLQKLSASHWTSSDLFYQALAQSIADQLDLDVSPSDVWSYTRGPNENCERFLRREVIGKAASHVVWALDEVDRLFTYPFSNDVFALFRSWHNERALDPGCPWHNLTLAISYATEAHLFITDLNQSPFNVGTRLTLDDFTFAEVAELNRRHNAVLNDAELARFFALVRGNPYLIRRGLQEIVTRSMTFDAFADQADQNEGCYRDHLHGIFVALAHDSALCAVVRDYIHNQAEMSHENFYRLRSAGVMTGSIQGGIAFRCPLYQAYLERHL